MGKYRQDEIISYKLEKSFSFLDEGVSQDYKEGYLEAIKYVKNQVEKNKKYYESKGDNRNE